MAQVPRKHLVWVCGHPGAGKTTLGNLVKERRQWLHFDGDSYTHGGDPIRDTGIPTKEMLDRRDPELQRVYLEMADKGFGAVSRGQKPPLSAWTPFYDRMCADVLRTFQQHPHSMVVTHALPVYDEALRAHISSKLPDLTWIILEDIGKAAAKREVKQVKDAAAAEGKTMSEYLTKFDAKWADVRTAQLHPL